MTTREQVDDVFEEIHDIAANVASFQALVRTHMEALKAKADALPRPQDDPDSCESIAIALNAELQTLAVCRLCSMLLKGTFSEVHRVYDSSLDTLASIEKSIASILLQ